MDEQKVKEFIVSRFALKEILQESPSPWKEMTPDGNCDPYEEIKNSSKGNSLGKYIRHYKYILLCSSISWLKRQLHKTIIKLYSCPYNI